jgi:hypothetical protein
MSEILFTRGTPELTLSLLPRAEVTLYQMAEVLLDRTRQAFTQRGVSLPSRQLIYMPPLPVDCEQVAVLIGGWVPLPPWDSLVSCQTARWCGSLDVVVSRASPAVPKGARSAPTAEQMNAAAQIASEDAEALLGMVRGLGEIGAEFLFATNPAQGAYQTTVVQMQIPAFGGLE